MKLIEAIEYIKSCGLILESPAFNMMDDEIVGRSAKMTAMSHNKAGRNNVKYDDDQRYNDYQGIKWLDVKKRDNRTLASAIIDGMTDVVLTDIDTHIEDLENKLKFSILSPDVQKKINDDIVASEKNKKKIQDMYNSVSNMDELSKFIDDVLDIEANDVNTILNFLDRYKHGMTTVYRGFSFTDEEYEKLVGNADMRKTSSILQFLNNKTKKFNSFSTNPNTAEEFSKSSRNGNHSFVIAAEVEPNDINFAFTAYLMGRHGTISEYELNINNLKDLKNLRVVTDIDAEIKRLERKLPSVESLQSMIDKSKDINKVFDQCRTTDFGDDIYIGLYNGYSTLIKKNKVLFPLTRSFFENVCKDVILIYDVKGSIKLFNLNTGFMSNKLFIDVLFDSTNTYAIGVVSSTEKYLFNVKTGKPIIKKPLSVISFVNTQGNVFPKDWFMIKLKDVFTIINSNCETVFYGANRYFERIDVNTRKAEIICKLSNGSEKTYICKNNRLIEVYK